MRTHILYVGVRGYVTAVDKKSGETLWHTKLKTSFAVSGEGFVTLLVEDGRVFAHTYGRLFCLETESGDILWENELQGLGYGIASLAVEGSSSSTSTFFGQRNKNSDSGASGDGGDS